MLGSKGGAGMSVRLNACPCRMRAVDAFRSVRSTLRGAARGVALIVALVVVPAPSAWAQTTDTDELEREITAAEERARAAGEALDYRAVEDGEPLSYADVLRDPDNIDLNFRFARQQVRRGDVRGAAATLERILLINPDLAQVRLFYAVVLFRLDNVDEAEREFRAVAALDIPAEVRAELDSYLGSIKRQRQTTRYTASLSLGAHFDTNRDASPSSGSVLFLDAPIILDAAGKPFKEDDDVGYLGIGTLRVDHDLGYQERHELFGELTYYHDEQVQQDPFDLQAFIFKAGGVYRSPFWDIDVVPSVFRTHLRLSRETFFQDFGFDLRFEREFGPRIKAFAGTRLSDQTFSPINENTASQLRDGRQIEGILGATYVIDPAMRISGDYLRFDKNAKGKFFGYARDQFRVNLTVLLGEGQYMLTQVSYQRDRYDQPDFFISSRTRHDDLIRTRFTYGAPLVVFFGLGTLPRQLEDVTFGGSVEMFRAHSNLENFGYRNIKVQALLTKTWRF